MDKQFVSEPDLHGIAGRINDLVQQLSGCADPIVRQQAQELVRLVMQLYGSALTRILGLLEPTAVKALVADDLIASLLVLHDLHPENTPTRIEAGLERVAALTGAKLTVLRLEGDSVHVLVDANSAVRSVSASELRKLIEGVIQATAPEITIIEIEGLADAVGMPLIQLTRTQSQTRGTRISAS